MVASSSRPRGPVSDVFRPRLPLDPFATIDRLRPWPVPAHALPGLLLDSAHRRSVVLVLGEPPAADLVPLLSSLALSSSLLLIATHVPHALALPSAHSPLSASAGPAIRILRLSTPLAVQDAGALRLVSLFERAERVAATWRSATMKDRRIVQLAEVGGTGGEFSIVEEHGMRPQSPPKPALERYPSPTPSTTSSNSHHQKPSSRKFRPSSASSSSTSLPPTPKKSKPRTSRPFDAILNFLPASVPDKALLKHAILVTTISAPFLVSVPAAPPSAFQKKQNRASVFSMRAFSSSDASVHEQKGSKRLSAVPPPAVAEQRTKLVHVLPPTYHHREHSFAVSSTFSSPSSSRGSTPATSRASSFSSPHYLHPHTPPSTHKPHLAQSIEQFLLSFADPLPSFSLSSNSPGSFIPPPNHTDPGATDKPAPYLLAAGVFSHPVGASKLYVGELLLLGALDATSASAEGKERYRAWIGDGADVLVTGVLDVDGDVEVEGKGKAMQHDERAPAKRPHATPTGLPTPPESESSLESAGGDDDDDEMTADEEGWGYDSTRRRSTQHYEQEQEPSTFHYREDNSGAHAPPHPHPQGNALGRTNSRDLGAGQGQGRASFVLPPTSISAPATPAKTGTPPKKLRRKSSMSPASSASPATQGTGASLSPGSAPKERRRVSSFFGFRDKEREREGNAMGVSGGGEVEVNENLKKKKQLKDSVEKQSKGDAEKELKLPKPKEKSRIGLRRMFWGGGGGERAAVAAAT